MNHARCSSNEGLRLAISEKVLVPKTLFTERLISIGASICRVESSLVGVGWVSIVVSTDLLV